MQKCQANPYCTAFTTAGLLYYTFHSGDDDMQWVSGADMMSKS